MLKPMLKQWLALVLLLMVATTSLAETAASPTRKLVVATRHVPPFAIKDEAGNWSGISIDLLKEFVADLGQESQQTVEVEFRELPLKDMLTAVEQERVDLAAAALTVNVDRESKMDFSHPFLSSGLGIAVVTENRSGWVNVLDRILSWTFLQIAAGLFGLLLLSGVLVYFFERRKNKEQFGGGFWRGLGAGLWWSIVTLTTVGYGDKAPRTGVGRIIAVVWMLSGVLIMSSFTAVVTSALTVGQLHDRIGGPRDLPRVRVATVADSTSQSYLQSRHIRQQKFAELTEALAALEAGKVEAVVYDAPLLRFQVLQTHPRQRVLTGTFERQDYALALPSNSPLREPINRAVLRALSQPEWEEKLDSYLGEQQ